MNKLKECIILITFFFIVIILYYLKIPIPCLFHKITNLYCPGCGVTRMIDAIIHINFKSAFSYTAYAFILLILSIIYLTINTVVYTASKRFIKIPKHAAYVLIVLAILFAILRNLPYFNFLAP